MELGPRVRHNLGFLNSMFPCSLDRKGKGKKKTHSSDYVQITFRMIGNDTPPPCWLKRENVQSSIRWRWRGTTKAWEVSGVCCKMNPGQKLMHGLLRSNQQVNRWQTDRSIDTLLAVKSTPEPGLILYIMIEADLYGYDPGRHKYKYSTWKQTQHVASYVWQ